MSNYSELNDDGRYDYGVEMKDLTVTQQNKVGSDYIKEFSSAADDKTRRGNAVAKKLRVPGYRVNDVVNQMQASNKETVKRIQAKYDKQFMRDNASLRPYQKTAPEKMNAALLRQASSAAESAAARISPATTDVEAVDIILAENDKFRRMYVDATMGSGKAMIITELAALSKPCGPVFRRCLVKRGVEERLVAKALSTHSRILLIVPGKAQVKEMAKEGLDPHFATSQLMRCGLVDKLGMEEDDVRTLAKMSYLASDSIDLARLAEARFVFATHQKIVSEISNGNMSPSDFEAIYFDEGDWGNDPCPGKVLDVFHRKMRDCVSGSALPDGLVNREWHVIQGFFSRSALIFFTGTPAEWFYGYTRYDGASVVPLEILKATYGDLIRLGQAKQFYYNPMMPACVEFSDGQSYEAGQHVADADRAAIRDSADVGDAQIRTVLCAHLARVAHCGMPKQILVYAAAAGVGNRDNPKVKQLAAA